MSAPAPATEPLPLLVTLPEREKQRRWTVLLRAILAVPLGVVVFFVGLAALVCVILGWFAAIFTGRAPAFVRDIVTTFLRMSLRLEAYLYLLTDRFPPFSADERPEYPVRLAVPPATRLNRAAVFFRLVLAIPASIVGRLVGLGLEVFAVFMWIVVLVTGWLPKPVHDAYRAFLRYDTRLLGYVGLLVPTYPEELFGDRQGPVPVLVPGEEEPGLYARAAGPAPEPTTEGNWRLVLGDGAKRIVVLAIGLGIAASIGIGVYNASLQNHQNLVQVNNQLVSNLGAFATTAHQCGRVACLEQADSTLSQQLASFVGALQGSNNAGVSQDLVDQLSTAAQAAQQVTAGLANGGSTLSEYQSTASRLHAAQVLGALIAAQHRFVTALNGS
jgi:hypothetical protein